MVIPVKKGTKKPLCIIGTAPTCKDAPYDDNIDGENIYDIWAIDGAITNPGVKRVDKLFEMHPKRYYGLQMIEERLKEFDGPVVMQTHVEAIPNSVAYPYDEVKKMFYHPMMDDNLYVTNTITWIILQALYEGYTDISLYGVHMAHDTEYAYQRSSCSWALGIVHGWIIAGLPYKLTIAPESSLFKAEYEYGFKEPTQTMQFIKGRIDGMNLGIKEANDRITTERERVLRTEGAVSEANFMYKKIAGLN